MERACKTIPMTLDPILENFFPCSVNRIFCFTCLFRLWRHLIDQDGIFASKFR